MTVLRPGADEATARDIHATLRGATSDGLLRDWRSYGGREGLPTRYVISLPNHAVYIYETEDAIRYCEKLLGAGVPTLYIN